MEGGEEEERLQEGEQREGGARKDVARPSSEPALEPKISFVGPKDSSSGVPKPKYPVGSCFRCGDPGHFQRECPKMVGLSFGLSQLRSIIAHPIWHSLSAVRCVYSDASEVRIYSGAQHACCTGNLVY